MSIIVNNGKTGKNVQFYTAFIQLSY